VRFWQITLHSFLLMIRYPLRSGLLMLSAAVGVSGVVCSVNYGASGTKQVLDQIRRLGTNVLIVTPTQSRSIAGRARTGAPVPTLVERDYAALKQEVVTRTRSSALATQSFWNKAGALSKNTTVVGCEPDYFLIKDWKIAAGEVFNPDQERTFARVAVLGRTVAVDLFGPLDPVGQRFLINRVPFTVLGVLSERGQGLDVTNEDNEIYVPLTTAMHRLMNVDHYSGILVEIDSLENMDKAAGQVRSIVRQLHHLRQNQPDDFQVQNQKTLLDTQRAAADRLGFFLRWIAGSALLISGLGIVAITWIAVKERTHELGTRRALGAAAADIFIQIQCETGTLAACGGLLGIGVSWPISILICRSAGLAFIYVRQAAFVAFSAATVLNSAFSLLPSRKAASVSPVEALRYE